MKLSRIFTPLAIVASLAGCGGVSSQKAALLGAATGYVGAKELGASNGVSVLAGVVGLVVGEKLGDPCQTRVSGAATEYIGSDGKRYKTQQQQTAYGCNTTGAPQGAKPPAFR